MRLLSDETDASKVRHQRYQLHFRNIPVEGAEFSLHSANGEVRTAHGKIVELLDIDVNKRIGEPKALEIALADKGLTVKDFKGDNKPPVGVLLIARNQPEVVKENYVLAYQFDVFGKDDAHAVYVNAVTGEIFRRDPLTLKCFHPHTGKSSMMKTEDAPMAMPHAALVASTFNPLNAARHGTNRTFETESAFNGQGFALRFNTSQANALQTRITNQGNFAANPDLIWNNLPEVVNPNTQWGNNNQEAATAHWFGQQAFQYYSGKFGRNGINGSGNIARVIVGFDETNARWTNNTARTINMMQFGRIETQTMATSDVYGHEYGHGITDHRGGLVPFGEATTLNEAISDIWGTSLERYTTSNWNWVLGDEFPAWAQRNMANPEATGQPATFEGPNWNPNSGPHQNTGFINRWFYLINTGFNNPLPQHNIVRPIEYEKAEKIVYGAYNYIQSNWGYADFRNATISAARDLYGECSFEMRQVQNAWQAVNLAPFLVCSTDAVDCDFTPSISVSNNNPACGASITLTASCSGQGCNPTCNGGGCTGLSYDWSGQGVDPYNSGGSPKIITVPNTTGTYTYTLTTNKYGYCNAKTTTVNINVNCGDGSSTCPNVGSISYQRWENIGGGTSIQDLRNNTNNLNNSPSHTQTLNSFEAPLNILDNYGVRIRGYVCPPTTGNYTFWVAGDDNSELWISGNDQPTNLSRIAYHTNWTPSLEWGWFSTQQSAPVTLQAGQRYYVEALMKEGGGGDNLAVGWQLPNGALERPILGNRLIPFDGGSGGNCNFSVSSGSSNQNPSCGASITLNANCSGSDCGSVNYSWSGNGLSGSGSSINTNVPSSNGTYTYTVTASKSGCNNQSGNVNVTVSGCSGGSSSCSSESIQCSGNQYEVQNYSVSASNATVHTIKVLYRSHEGPGVIRWSVNGGSVQTVNVNQTGINDYPEITLGTASITAGNNTVSLSSGASYLCFKKVCIQSGGRIGVAGEKEAMGEDTQTLQLYPNPTDGKVTVRYKLEKGQKASLQFINAKGQVLIQKGLVGEGGWGQNQTDLSAQPEGSYVVRMETQEKTVSRKFVIVK